MKSKRFFALIFILILFLSATPSDSCFIFVLKCIKPSFKGCCKFCFSHGCCCTKWKMWLPTVAAVAVPTSTMNADSDGGSASATHLKGQVELFYMDPKYVLRSMGFSPCRYGCKPYGQAKIRRFANTLFEWRWYNNPNGQILHLLSALDWKNLPRLLGRTRIEDRIYAASWIYVLRAIQLFDSDLGHYKIGVSPYSNMCKRPNYNDFSLLQKYLKENKGKYPKTFKNMFVDDPIDFFVDYTLNIPFRSWNFMCWNKAVGFRGWPVFFIWQKYKCCIKD